MNIPNLPTDNLYKLLSIFGLVIFAFSFIIKSWDLDEVFEIMNSTWQNEEKYRTFQKKYERLKEIELEKRILLDSLNTKAEELGLVSIKNLKLELVILDSALIKLEDDLFFLTRQVETESKKFDLLEPKWNYYDRVGDLMSYLGVFSILFGFTMWYLKQQRYLDAEIKWKGESFIELLKDKEKKQKAIQDELKKSNNKMGDEPKA